MEEPPLERPPQPPLRGREGAGDHRDPEDHPAGHGHRRRAAGGDRPVEGAQVQIINRSTGYSSAATTRSNGLYLVAGLEVGGPYTVRVRRLGFQPVERNDIAVSLSQTTRVDIQLVSHGRNPTQPRPIPCSGSWHRSWRQRLSRPAGSASPLP